ncbi:hypothetical protein PENTCL1PPCAC_20739, partial [Pristionchus entomophagus]
RGLCPVPSLLYSNLDEALKIHSFAGLSLKYLRIDSALLSFLENTVGSIKWIKLVGIRIDPEYVERLFSLILKHTPRRLELRHAELEVCALFNENSLEDYLKNNKWNEQCCILVDSWADISE